MAFEKVPRALLSLFLTVAALPALAQQYLPQADLATCQARSHLQCRKMSTKPDGSLTNCRTPAEDGVLVADSTQYQWPCTKLTGPDGSGNTAAVTIFPGSLEGDVTATNDNGTHGLDGTEQTALRTRAQMSTKLRDIIASGVWLGRLTQVQKDRITTFVSTRPALKTRWDAINAGADVDLQAAAVQAFIQALRAGNVVNDSDVTALNARQSVP